MLIISKNSQVSLFKSYENCRYFFDFLNLTCAQAGCVHINYPACVKSFKNQTGSESLLITHLMFFECDKWGSSWSS